MAKKPSLALVIAGKGEPDGDEPDGDEGYSDSEDAAADELADAAGVPEESRDAFKEALHAYVQACVAKAMK
jgi:hypothetical protein